MAAHRRGGKSDRRKGFLSSIEPLENRLLLTVLGMDDEFEFQQAPGQQVRIQVSGNVLAEFVGAVVDDTNQIILTDLPGHFFGSGTGRSGSDVLGGIGGRDGMVPVGSTTITDPQYAPGTLIYPRDLGQCNLGALAANSAGDMFGINVGTVIVGGTAPPRRVVQVVQLDNSSGAGTVRSMIQEATLAEDVVGGLTVNINGPVGDVAIDPTTGLMYVVSETGNLYSIDRASAATVFIGQLRNTSTGVVLNNTRLAAMAFDATGQLWVITQDYDNNPGADASGVPINNNAPPGNVSNRDVALIAVNKATATFANANIHTIMVGTFETEVWFTAMVFEPSGNILAVGQPPAAAAGGGGAAAAQPWQMFRLNVAGGVGPGAPVAAVQIGGNVQAGAQQLEIHGLAFATNIFNQVILVGNDNSSPGQGQPARTRLVGTLYNGGNVAPGAFTALSRDNSIVFTGGLASYLEPGHARPLLWTTDGNRLIRGSAVSLEVDPATGVSQVTAATAADFDPISGLMYFATTEGGGASILHSINPLAPNRSEIQNTLTRSATPFPAVVTGLAFDQTSPFTADLVGVDVQGRLLDVNIANASASTLSPQVLMNCAAISGFTDMEFIGDDPTGPEQFVYLIQNAGANSQILRVRRSNPLIAGSPPTAIPWGMLPDPDDIVAPIRGQDIQGFTWNPNVINPFTKQLGALMATDQSSDELVFIDTRMRPPSVNLFHIHISQSDVSGIISIAQVPANPAAVDTFNRPMQPFNGDVGTFRVVNAQYLPPYVLVDANPNTGAVLLGIKTRNVDCVANNDDLRPIAPAAEMRGYTPAAPISAPFGMVGQGDGWLPTGVFVTHGGVVSPITAPAGRMIGSNLDLVSAASVRQDGLIALIDSDFADVNDAGIPNEGDQLAIINPGGTVAINVVNVTDPALNNLGHVQAIDWADPDGDGVEELYAVYPISGVPVLGTLDINTGIFRPIGPVAGGTVAGIQAMAFSPYQRLYVVTSGGQLMEIDPTTGAQVAFLGIVPFQVKSMDFDFYTGTLYAHDVQNERLVDIDIATGTVGGVVATTAGSMRASIGAMAFDPLLNRWIGFDNSISRERLGDADESLVAESSMLVDITGLTNASVVVQDLGRFLLGGCVTGQVSISGSIGMFYAGWLLTGASGGQYLTVPEVSQNFRVGGEIRNLLVLDSIGTHDASAFANSTYTTGFDMAVGGTIGEVLTAEDLMGGADVVNNGPALPLAVQLEVEGKPGPVGSGFQSGNLNHTSFYNDTFATAEYLGTINGALGTDVIQVQGFVDIANGDPRDFYSVALMAGQSVVTQVIPLSPFTIVWVGVYDPDGRLIATDYSDWNPDAYHYQRFVWTADRPGLYRFVVGSIGAGNFEGDPPAVPWGPYELRVMASLDGTTAPGIGDVAVGAIAARRHIFDGRMSGPQFRVQQGHLGGLVAGQTYASMIVPRVLSELAYMDPVPPPDEAAIERATVEINNGDLRTIEAGSVGILTAMGPALGVDLDVFNGSVGLIRSTGTGGSDMLVLNDDIAALGPPAVSDHDIPGVARQVAIRGAYQVVSSATDYYGALLTRTSIGVVRAENMTYPGFYVANADLEGDDGVIDLVQSNGDLGNQQSGGPAFITGPGGNVRYIVIGQGGTAWRDRYFGGGLPPMPEETLFQPGEAAVLNDDSGAEIKIAPASATGELRVITYGVRGSGGVVTVSVSSTASVTIRGTAIASDVGAEIGRVSVSGAGQAVTRDANGRLMLTPLAPGQSPLFVQIDGTCRTDVFHVVGGAFSYIANSTVGGEIVNVDATSIGRLEAGSIGVARHVTPAILNALPVRANAYPFVQQRISVNSGDIVLAKAKNAIGNLNVTGSIGQIVADSDRIRRPGDFDGIVGPIFATEEIQDVTIGQGISSSGHGAMAHSGLFAEGRIGIVRGDNADIRGAVVSTDSIGRIQLTNNGSIINAGILCVEDLAMAREWVAKMAIPVPDTDPFTGPTYEVGDIFVQGALPRKGRAPLNGGIIGSIVVGADIGTTNVTRGFGLINSFYGVIGDGVFKDFLIDGYGIRDDVLIAGAAVGRLVATGKGALLPTTNFSRSVRYSENSEFIPRQGENDWASRFEPNATTDLHRYLGTTAAMPVITAESVSNAGVIAGTTVRASRNLDTIQAWQVRPSTRMGLAYSDFDIANKIRYINILNDIDDIEITTGSIWRMLVGRDVLNSSITVAGVFSTLQIGRNYVGQKNPNDHDIINAIGANGQINSIYVGGYMDGLIRAQRKIGKYVVRGGFRPGARIMQGSTQIAP